MHVELILLLFLVLKYMTKTTRAFTVSGRVFAGAALAAAALISLPSFASAASYGFVNHSGEVSMVTADTANSAMATAFNISLHSGVILLSNPTGDGMVGDQVSGI